MIAATALVEAPQTTAFQRDGPSASFSDDPVITMNAESARPHASAPRGCLYSHVR